MGCLNSHTNISNKIIILLRIGAIAPSTFELYLFHKNMSNILLIGSLLSMYIGYKSDNIYKKILSVIIAILFVILVFK